MNEPIRRLSVVSLLLVMILMIAVSWVQFGQASELNADQRNVRTLYREFGTFRGPFVVDGEAIVYSQPIDSPFNYQRTYTNGPLFAHVTGFYSIGPGRTGLERTENELLNGISDQLFWSRLQDLFAGREQEGASVELTLKHQVQAAAAQALGDQAGAVVALDPRSGAILSLYSSPSYDPAALAVHSSSVAGEAYGALLADPRKPLINRAIAGDTYPPGSTFKLVVAAAALESGYRPDTLLYAPQELSLPDSTAVIRNFGGAACGSNDTTTLAEALRISCNTAFSELGMSLGWGPIARTAAKFGWGEPLNIPLAAAAATLPTGMSQALIAQSSLGQYDVRATPLQMAMVAAAIANDGVLMRPYLVSTVRAPDLRVISQAEPEVLSNAVSPESAAALQEMMVEAVRSGTGTQAQIAGVTVGGKTGTAETGNENAAHAWFVAFAPAQNPVVAVAVLVENGGVAGGTGGEVAAPIAREVLAAALAEAGMLP